MIYSSIRTGRAGNLAYFNAKVARALPSDAE
jgi:hypothetical protein